MSTQTILLVVLAAILSLGLSIFQYYFRSRKTKINPVLAFLRFISWFSALLLLINPKFTREDYFIEKSNLVLLFDNSKSVQNLQGVNDAETIWQTVTRDNVLNDRFSVQVHYFSNGLKPQDSLDFNGGITNISGALEDLNEIYGTSKTTYILVTDGNQNIGSDFEFEDLGSKSSVFPVVVGDTTRYDDLYIPQVNVNRYAFLDNQFPFEANISYSGNRPVQTQLNIYLEGRRIFSEALQLSKNNNAATVTGFLKANTVGFKNLRFEAAPISGEKNRKNNSKEVAIEVIDEQTKIALVSSMLHPDLGALKKAIEQNEQRSVEIVKPNNTSAAWDGYDFFILYQPNRQFDKVFKFLNTRNLGSFLITGTKTDWSYLNSIQDNFQKESFNQPEEVIPQKNEAYSIFDSSDFEVDEYPPLRTQLGEVSINVSHDVLLWQQIRGVDLEAPLFFTFQSGNTKSAVLFGENIWQWRAQAFRETRSFDAFDRFMEQLIRYLADVQKRSRLELTYDPIFNNPSMAKIGAAFFDEAYNFKPETNLVLSVKKVGASAPQEIPMILKSNTFEADLSSLQAGDYVLTVTAKDENISKSGRFKILDFDLEGQLASANPDKLKRLAQRNAGQLFFPSQLEVLITKLQDDPRFTPIQKSIKNVVSLIDFRWLLGLLAVSLALEWFIRKYNGLL